MEPLCVADKLAILIDTLQMDDEQRRTHLEAISDLRAAFCSYCNRMLHIQPSEALTKTGKDNFKNDMYKCHLCIQVASKQPTNE